MAGRIGNTMRIAGLSALVSLGAAGILGGCGREQAAKPYVCPEPKNEITNKFELGSSCEHVSQVFNNFGTNLQPIIASYYNNQSNSYCKQYGFLVNINNQEIPVGFTEMKAKDSTNKTILFSYQLPNNSKRKTKVIISSEIDYNLKPGQNVSVYQDLLPVESDDLLTEEAEQIGIRILEEMRKLQNSGTSIRKMTKKELEKFGTQVYLPEDDSQIEKEKVVRDIDSFFKDTN